jgi:ATP-dependent DNA ligase
VLYAQYVAKRGRELFAEVYTQNLEGIVAKHGESSYGADEPRQWITVKNTAYSQAVDRHELFER